MCSILGHSLSRHVSLEGWRGEESRADGGSLDICVQGTIMPQHPANLSQFSFLPDSTAPLFPSIYPPPPLPPFPHSLLVAINYADSLTG